MSARLRTWSSAFSLNSSKEDNDSRDVAHEFKMFNISMLSLSACVLTVIAMAWCVSCVNRWRHRKRKCEYESAVACDLGEEPVNLKVMRRSQSLWRSESARRDESNIYTNPLPVRCHDDEVKDDVRPTGTHTATKVTDPRDGVILDPPTFYMQL